MNRKICIFTAQYLPSTGGVERYTYNVAKGLSERGMEVTIVTSDLYAAPLYEETGKIKIYRLPCINLMNARFPIVRYNADFRKKMKEIERQKYDLVITNTRFYPLSLVGAYIGKKYAKRSIVIEHGTSHLKVHNPIFDLLEQVFEHAITFLVKCYCKEFYGVSEACNEWLKHFHIKAVSTLYNAIDAEQIARLGQKKNINIREQCGIPQDDTMISFTGRILKEKGVFQLVQAFNRIKLDYPNIALVIAGEGPMLEELKSESGENVYFLGQIPFESVVALLKESSIFCLPSDSEGMPTSVLEAMACENFVITTQKGGAKEIILDDSYGIIMENNAVDSVEAALRKVLASPEDMINATEKSYHRVIQNFTWDVVINKIEKLIGD